MKKNRIKYLALLVIALLLIGVAGVAAQGLRIHIDGKAITSDVDPFIHQARTMVPIRVITENFGADVSWIAETRTVEIVSPYKKFLQNYQAKGMYLTQAQEVLNAYNANPNAVAILDVRPAALVDEYIVGSRNIPLPTLIDNLAEVPADRMIAVYCTLDVNAAYAVAILNMLGYDAYVMVGGKDAWVAAGGAVTTEPIVEEEEEVLADIVDTAIAAGSFTTLVAALQAADFVEPLKAAGPYTVFAPTDEAFAQLPEGTVEDLLLPENLDALQAILAYHVVAGSVLAEDVVALTSAETLLGQDLAITIEDGNVFINDAQVIITDIICSNGVIHVIDAVLLPPAE